MLLYRLLILDAFAQHGEMHGYALRQLLDKQGLIEWAAMPKSTAYGTLTKLHREGLLDAVRTERPGSRPARQIFEITPSGIDELARLRDEAKSQVASFADPFDFILSRVDPMTTSRTLQERLEIFRERLYRIEARRNAEDSLMSEGDTRALGHREAVLRAEIAWHEAQVHLLR